MWKIYDGPGISIMISLEMIARQNICMLLYLLENGMLIRAGARRDLGTYRLGEAQSMDVDEG